jgi:4-diphosphocytidyl-2-C-methyl-D-erythritol kinase
MQNPRKDFSVFLRSPAKINLHLSIGKKRPDGFHGIESIFLPVSHYDHIRIDFHFPAAPPVGHAAPPFSVAINGMDDVPLEKNLMYQAARLFHETTGIAFSIRITITKNIPQGAGLGGGSSNAATVLGALNKAFSFPVPHDRLLEMAARLGSDVPFFIEGKPAYVTGRGENLAPFILPNEIPLVLVKPAFGSGTAEAYRLLDAAPPRPSVPSEALAAAIEKPPSRWPYRNDFQSVFLHDSYPHSGAYQEIFAGLRESGACFTSLSGSGSTVFGVYQNENAAKTAAAALQTRFPFARDCAAICGNNPV